MFDSRGGDVSGLCLPTQRDAAQRGAGAPAGQPGCPRGPHAPHLHGRPAWRVLQACRWTDACKRRSTRHRPTTAAAVRRSCHMRMAT
eukprot:356096-Chlamydomonas_euryale.AAC.7